MREICGCIHLHTKFSDGGCDYDALIGAANGAGLDYICVTDHMCLDGLRIGRDGQHGNVFVLVGYEHNDGNNLNHYLAFGINEVVADLTEPQDYIDGIKALGGIGFLAHPAEERDYIKTLPPYPWTKLDEARGFDGIEIWNQISDWMEQLRGWHSFTHLFFPNRLVRGAPRKLLNIWDSLNRERFVSAIGGVDAHTRALFSFGPIRIVIFPIKTELRGIRTHLFVNEADWDGSGDKLKKSEALISAMKHGKGFMSNFGYGDARGAKIFLRDETGAIEYPGRPSNNLSLPMTLNVSLPHAAKITLLRNGSVIQSTPKSAKSLSWAISAPGVYRIEASKNSHIWIYSNPFPVGQYPL